MAEGDNWTGGWAAKTLTGHEHVSRVRQLAPKRLEVERHGLPPALVATLSAECLDREALESILRSTPRPDFVLNLHPRGALTVEALLLSVEEQLPVGRMGDLNRALYMDAVREYVEPETRFRERGLKQHSRVIDFQRLDFHRYRIERRGLSPLTVVFLNDYELGAEAIRHAREKYGPFDIVVASNPNGTVTAGAEEVAARLACEIHQWGAFLSRLHREHN